MADIIVIGSGVVGLAAGVRLLQAGHGVTIIARDLPPATTSNVAAAIWSPYKAFPRERVLGWSAASLAYYYQLAADPATGVGVTDYYELFDHPVEAPWWQSAVRHYWRPPPDDLPAGYVDGHGAEVAIIETPIFMAWLVDHFRRLGGRVEQRTVTDLAALAVGRQIVVNCTGLGARDLANDDTVYPIRGQIIRIARPAGLDKTIFDESTRLAPAYVIPRSRDVILGGTAQAGNWDLSVDPATIDTIWEKCGRLAPVIAEAQVLDHLVGLRPGRDVVRLEVEQLAGGRVIHNYGHGGAGFTLAWGCADEVVGLVGSMA